MKKMEFQLPYYKVDITLLQVESEKDADKVATFLKSMDVEDPEYTLDGIKRGAVNGGETYRNLDNKRMVVLFYPMEDNTSYIEGYQQAEKDLELTWEDINRIEIIIKDVYRDYPHGIEAKQFGIEVLNRFNKRKGE